MAGNYAQESPGCGDCGHRGACYVRMHRFDPERHARFSLEIAIRERNPKMLDLRYCAEQQNCLALGLEEVKEAIEYTSKMV